MVSDLGGVILILFVITAELCASYQQNVESAIWYFPNNCRVHSRCQTGVFWWYVWHGTQLFKALCNTPRYDISMQCSSYRYYVMNMLDVWYECVMDVLWKCYGCVMKVLWKCYESVMDVLRMCYGCVRYVMDVWGMLWMCEECYGCVRNVMDVWGMLLMCEVYYGCVKDVCVMDEWWIFYIYCVSCIINGIVIVIL